MSNLNNEINRRVALDCAIKLGSDGTAEMLIKNAKQIDEYLHSGPAPSQSGRVAALEAAIRDASERLHVARNSTVVRDALKILAAGLGK